ncbi:hypothetical protein [Nocardia sp. NPDC050435]|uniref:hypothetical protein n=1 Tax=Nocardia sp. NPDC050435 TaxID=3155040 RepID=UPI0034038205
MKIDGWRHHVSDEAAASLASAAEGSDSAGLTELAALQDEVSVREAQELLGRKGIVAASHDAGAPRAASSVSRWSKQGRIPDDRTYELTQRRAFVARLGGVKNAADALGTSAASVSSWQSGKTEGFRGTTTRAFQRAQLHDARDRAGQRPIRGARISVSTLVEYRSAYGGGGIVSQEYRGSRTFSLHLDAAGAEDLAVALRTGDHPRATALVEAGLTADFGTFADYSDAAGVHLLEVDVLDIDWS